MCAVAIQLDLQGHNEGEISEPILVRMGLHTGEMVKEGEDYFGRNVILASRISSLAQEDQVLVSSLSKGLVDSLRDFQFEDPMTVNLKGLAGTTVVYPVKYRKNSG
jgi:class 3 adenylate cyclase